MESDPIDFSLSIFRNRWSNEPRRYHSYDRLDMGNANRSLPVSVGSYGLGSQVICAAGWDASWGG